MKQLAALTAALTLAVAAPAQALQFSNSSTTGKDALILNIGSETPPLGPVSLGLNVRLVPVLSSLLGPAKVTAGYSEVFSGLLDANMHLYYHFPLMDEEFMGRFNPTLAPFVGLRYLGMPLSEVQPSVRNPASTFSYSQYTGLNYGLKAYTQLPLGFVAHAQGGLTTLLGGGWDERANGISVTNAGKVAVGGATLPFVGVGASWSGAGLVTLSVGYETMMLPTNLRTHGTQLSTARTVINSFTVGGRILIFSF